MQPHVPFIGETQLDVDSEITSELRDMVLEDSIDDAPGVVWAKLQNGAIEEGVFWEAYRDNLIRVLEESVPLAKDLPGKTVITADHGNALGECAKPFPIPVYFHPTNIHMPELNTVPWFVPPYTERKRIVRSGDAPAETIDKPAAADESVESDESTVEDRLSALGYVD